MDLMIENSIKIFCIEFYILECKVKIIFTLHFACLGANFVDDFIFDSFR